MDKFETWFPVVVDLLKLTLGVGALLLGRWYLRHRHSWPSVFATIEMSRVVENDEAGGYLATLTYSFQAAGEFYSGSHIKAFKRERNAERYAAQFPKGSSVVVRYKPEKPDHSTIDDAVLRDAKRS